ncbi:hypothetical protein [Neomesorhizobium albiziae]|nr:hypothetical protein [Mesorhizobium albiziae]
MNIARGARGQFATPAPSKAKSMLDIILLASGVAAFVLFFAYVSACDHL